MEKKDLFIGVLLGILVGFLGSILVILFLSKGDNGIVAGYNYLKSTDSIGKVITLGSIPNLLLFFILLKNNRELMARGIILALFILTIITLVL